MIPGGSCLRSGIKEQIKRNLKFVEHHRETKFGN